MKVSFITLGCDKNTVDSERYLAQLADRGAEYTPVKNATGKGAATGKLKYLVFNYGLVRNKWVEREKPKWESQDLGLEAARKMTASAQRAEKYKEAQAKLKARADAAQRALNKH